MSSVPTANELAGRSKGVLFSAGFGALWFLIALYARQSLTFVAALPVLLGLLPLIAAMVLLRRRAADFPSEPRNHELGLAFGHINATEWIAIVAVSFVLSYLHLDLYIPSAIAVIVGLHMFPLARLFHYSPHYATGSALILWAAVSLFVVPPLRLQSVTCFGAGVIQWLSAVLGLVLGFLRAHQGQRALA